MRTRSLPTLGLAVLALAACSTSAAEDPTGGDAPAAEGYPVTVENCGRTVTFDAPPERVVSGWPTSTELLIELGLEGRLAGQYNTTSSLGGPREEYAQAYDAVEVLSEAAPSREVLLSAEPDLVWADGTYLFDGQQLPTVEELAGSGIQVLVLSGFCDDGGTSSVDDVFTDLDTLGTALGVGEDTDALAAEVEERLAAVAEATEGRPVVDAAVVSTYEGVVYTYEGVYSDMLDRAGGRNVLAGSLPEGDYFGELSAEELIAADPGALVYLLSEGESEQDARDLLRADYPEVAAVAEDRLVFVPQIDSTNLRVVDGVESLAEQLDALR